MLIVTLQLASKVAGGKKVSRRKFKLMLKYIELIKHAESFSNVLRARLSTLITP